MVEKWRFTVSFSSDIDFKLELKPLNFFKGQITPKFTLIFMVDK